MIDPKTYQGYMTAIADRLRFPFSDAMNALYYASLSAEMTTEQFVFAAGKVFAEYDEFGFPNVAVFRAALQGPAPVVNAAPILRQIEKLSHYSPQAGMIAPHVAKVRAELGDLIADAYATAGGARCLSDDHTTRDIAQREFQKAMTQYAATPAEKRPLLETPADVKRLVARNGKPESITNVLARLPSGEAA